MLATEIRILHMTSTLTMGVLGGLKEISIVIVSSFALHETMAVKQVELKLGLRLNLGMGVTQV